ncbi:MAG: Wzz/FepE/Etk N-terminal domain-containing protein [candidate division Zixibacteria bacterium]|nr:Wzz/FepE/Etk N-terminal domain-containing protein [candidate division Zixibacteria bacterium]
MTLRNSSQKNSANSGVDGSMAALNNVDAASFNLIEMFSIILRKKKRIFGAVTIVTIITAAFMFLIPNKYISMGTILPSIGRDKVSDLKKLAGLDNSVGKDENPSELFPVILQSQSIGKGVLANRYNFKYGSKEISLNLMEYFREDNPDKLYEALAGITSVSTEKKTGVITVSVETKYPELSQLILREYIAQLEDFNLNKRRSNAKENARYLSAQLDQTQKELEMAENNLEEFQSANRDWDNSDIPEIVTTLKRLQREIEMKSQTYLFLYQQYQSAKLDVQKDVPIVRILDSPSLPTIKSGPKRLNSIILSAILTLFASLSIIILMEAVRKRTSIQPAAYNSIKQDIIDSFPYAHRIVNRLKNHAREATTLVDK